MKKEQDKKLQIFLKEHWFKIGILIIFVIGIIIFYQGSLDNQLISNTTNSENNLALAKQCREDGEKIHQENIDTATRKKLESEIVNCFYMEPAFIFNSELDACLYSGGYTCDLKEIHTDGFFKGDNVTQWSRQIVDIYTNKTIESVYVENSANVEDWKRKQIDDFWSKSEELGF